MSYKKEKEGARPVREKHGMFAAEKSFSEEVQKNINGVNERQQKILEYVKQTSQAKISDFFTFFTDISSKTIQRDLQGLVAKNILKKEGEKRWTIYSLAAK
jgi:predicted HTH transcriptional regulator